MARSGASYIRITWDFLLTRARVIAPTRELRASIQKPPSRVRAELRCVSSTNRNSEKEKLETPIPIVAVLRLQLSFQFPCVKEKNKVDWKKSSLIVRAVRYRFISTLSAYFGLSEPRYTAELIGEPPASQKRRLRGAEEGPLATRFTASEHLGGVPITNIYGLHDSVTSSFKPPSSLSL